MTIHLKFAHFQKSRSLDLLEKNSSLNRISWKRNDTQFMNSCILANSLWIVFEKGQPLVHKTQNESRTRLAYLTLDLVQDLLGKGQVFRLGEMNITVARVKQLESARLQDPRVVYLGTVVPDDTSSTFIRELTESGGVHKYPSYFTLDVASNIKGRDALLKSAASAGLALEFVEPRSAATAFSRFDTELFAEARSMIDWNLRNKVLKRICEWFALSKSIDVSVLSCMRTTEYFIVGGMEVGMLNTVGCGCRNGREQMPFPVVNCLIAQACY